MFTIRVKLFFYLTTVWWVENSLRPYDTDHCAVSGPKVSLTYTDLTSTDLAGKSYRYSCDSDDQVYFNR